MIDTNVIISFLFPTDKSETAREILEASNGPVTIMSVLEEAAYVGLSLIYGCHGFKLRDQLRKEEFKHEWKAEADEWLPCCQGSFVDMNLLDQRPFKSAKGVFDCRCSNPPTEAEFPRVY